MNSNSHRPVIIALVSLALLCLAAAGIFFALRWRAALNKQPGAPRAEVPAGAFISGCDPALALCESGEIAREGANRINLPAFKIDVYEVTNEEFARCAQSGACAPNTGGLCETRTRNGRTISARPEELPSSVFAPDRPAVCVSRETAAAYCRFARGRLPTDEEWEKAARGADGRTFPWGNAAPPRRANTGKAQCCGPDASDGFARSAPPGSFPYGASPSGALDMAGNVWEWTSGCHGASCAWASARGGSFRWTMHEARASNRAWLPPETRADDVGFRCIYQDR